MSAEWYGPLLAAAETPPSTSVSVNVNGFAVTAALGNVEISAFANIDVSVSVSGFPVTAVLGIPTVYLHADVTVEVRGFDVTAVLGSVIFWEGAPDDRDTEWVEIPDNDGQWVEIITRDTNWKEIT